MVRTSVVFLF